MSRLTILVCSKSELKIDAVRCASRKLLSNALAGNIVKTIDIIGVSTESGISEQPVGDSETMQGALNRLNGAASKYQPLQQQQPHNVVTIAIENGLHKVTNEIGRTVWSDFATVVGRSGDNGEIVSISRDCCDVPETLIPTDNTSTWGEIGVEKGFAQDSKDPHRSAYFGGISRKDILVPIIYDTLNQLFRKQKS